jgi:hypothetical protein
MPTLRESSNKTQFRVCQPENYVCSQAGRPPSRAQTVAVMESNQGCFATPQRSCRSVAGSFAEILLMGLAWTSSYSTPLNHDASPLEQCRVLSSLIQHRHHTDDQTRETISHQPPPPAPSRGLGQLLCHHLRHEDTRREPLEGSMCHAKRATNTPTQTATSSRWSQ